jgi:transposase InsO family protein
MVCAYASPGQDPSIRHLRFSYIEGFYNPGRRHSRLDNLSPADFEKILTQQMTQTEASA